MILVYRPELENPPMDKMAIVGFSFINKQGLSDYYPLSGGVTRDFPEDVWERIKDYPVVKNLLSLGALRIEEETEEVEATPEKDVDSIAEMALPKAMKLIEDSFDPNQLDRWAAKDQRVKVINAIASRKEKLLSGNG